MLLRYQGVATVDLSTMYLPADPVIENVEIVHVAKLAKYIVAEEFKADPLTLNPLADQLELKVKPLELMLVETTAPNAWPKLKTVCAPVPANVTVLVLVASNIPLLSQ